MSLDISKLENVRAKGTKTIARCPACKETGHDQNGGEHLVINADGSFGCVVYPGDSADAKAHRKRIFALCGDRGPKPLTAHSSVLGRLGRVNQSQLAGEPLKTGLLGRLGRLFQTHSGVKDIHQTTGPMPENTPQTLDKPDKLARDPARVYETGVLGVPAEQKPPSILIGKKLPLRQLPFVKVYSRILDEEIYFCEDAATKAALVQAGTDQFSIYTKDELRVLVAQNRVAPFSRDELRKVHELKRTFNARIPPQ
jgi:hypothetical protein